MKNRTKTLLLSSFLFGVSFSACASHAPQNACLQRVPGTKTVISSCSEKEDNQVIRTLPYKSRLTPIVERRYQDSAQMIDMGVVLKTWVSPYVDSDENLHGGGDIWVVVEKPQFIVGEKLPKRSRVNGRISNSYGGTPFTLRDEEVPVQKIQNYKEYINNVETSNTDKYRKKKDEESSKFDDALEKFLKKERNK